MNNYCIHLKKRKNKPYCNVIRKEISLSQCRECVNKEYKKSTFKEKSQHRKRENFAIKIKTPTLKIS